MRTKVGQPFSQTTLDADKTAIENLGFFQAVSPRAKLLDDGTYAITIDVTEFEVIKEVRVVGNKGVSTDEILSVIDLKPGEVFNVKRIQPNVKAITALYKKRGFFGNVDEFGPMRDSPSTINISIVELKVGKLVFEGMTRTRPSVISRLIKTKPGEPFNETKWTNDLRRLYSTQWFDNPQVIDENPDPGTVNLTLKLKDARTGNFGIGLQVDPRSSIGGFIRLSDTNFHGSGQSVGASVLQAATGGPSVDLNYGNPFFDNRDTSFNVSLYSRVVYRFTGTGFGGSDTPTNDNRYTERRTGMTLTLARPFNDYVTGSIGGRFEGIKTADLNTTLTDDFIKQDGTVGVLTFGLTRNRRDVDIEASRGDWLRFEFEPGYSNITEIGGQAQNSAILGSNFFSRFTAEYRAYWSPQPARDPKKLDEPRRVFALRVRAGTIRGEVPFFEQYFVGGSDTLRGYSEDRFWGRNQFISTLEYRHPIQKGFNAIGFVDYGGAWGGYGSVNEFTQSNRPNFHLGYGIGFSFRTPLGPIRLDFGFDDKGKSRTHFQIGTSF